MLTRILACLLAVAAPIHAATFNATDYGAVGDDSTDNTAAFTACLNAVIAAGGGKMVLPDGVYRGRIIIPPRGGPSWITIEIVGESEPPPVWGTIGDFPPRDGGTIVKSLATSGGRGDLGDFGQPLRRLFRRVCGAPQPGCPDL